MRAFKHEDGRIIKVLDDIQASAFVGAGWEEFEEKLPEKTIEEMTVKELQALAKEKGVEVPRGTDKTGILKLLSEMQQEASAGSDADGVGANPEV